MGKRLRTIPIQPAFIAEAYLAVVSRMVEGFRWRFVGTPLTDDSQVLGSQLLDLCGFVWGLIVDGPFTQKSEPSHVVCVCCAISLLRHIQFRRPRSTD